MPAILEDPSTHIPAPPHHNHSAPTLSPLHTSLPKANNAPVTLYPITGGAASLPAGLVRFLHAEFSAEVSRGNTYPMEEAMGLEGFAGYWFGLFGVVAVLDEDGEGEHGGEGRGRKGNGLREDRDWERCCLGTFYVKPNYPGRCSHVCNAGFLTTTLARGKGVGRIMGEAYLEYAPRLGYKYSVFNLVFENNTASIRIWEGLGFKVIGRVPGCARLENSEGLVDALIFGRELATYVTPGITGKHPGLGIKMHRSVNILL